MTAAMSGAAKARSIGWYCFLAGCQILCFLDAQGGKSHKPIIVAG